jgi:hypothetical protein
MFSIFAVKIIYAKAFAGPKPENQQHWIDMELLKHIHANSARIYNIEQFETFEVTVDFRSDMTKAKALRRMAELTARVREECPVAKQLGVTAGLLNGEGIVWKPVHVEAPLKLEKFTGIKSWVKTGVKSAFSTGEEVTGFLEQVKGW